MQESEALFGYIHSVEKFGTVDGPGIRYVVFFQGCPFRCPYCHNPDTWTFKDGDCVAVKDLIRDILRYRKYTSGGVTLSGGEPMAQGAFALALIRECHENDIHCAVDTSGGMALGHMREVIDEADLILLDIKHFDANVAFEKFGVDTQNTWALLDYCEEKSKPVIIRHVLVPGLTVQAIDSEGYALKDFESFCMFNPVLIAGAMRLRKYNCIETVELLTFHKLGEYKWAELGLAYELSAVEEPSEQVVYWSRKIMDQ